MIRRRQNTTLLIPLATLTLVLALSILWFPKNDPASKFDWTGIRKEVKDTILNLYNDYYDLTSHGVGEALRTPNQWYRQNWIKKNLTFEEAQLLKKFPSSKVKALAYAQSIKRKPKLVVQLMEEALQDTVTFVEYHSGCTSEYYLLCEYLNRIAFSLPLGEYPDLPTNIKVLNINNEEFIFLDSLYNYRISNKQHYFNQLPENRDKDYILLID